MILRVRTPSGDCRDIDYGPTPVEAYARRIPSGAPVIGRSGARIDDAEDRKARNAKRATTRAGRAA
jgi:hypothetical protein